MPDITMCKGDGCPIRQDCWRHMAPHNPQYQSFFAETPGGWMGLEDQTVATDAWICDYFGPIRKGIGGVKCGY